MTLSGRTKVLSQTLGDRVPRSGVRAASIWRSPAGLAGASGCHGRQLEDRILAQWSDGFQRHVAGALHGPLSGLLEQDCTDQAGDGSLVGEDADDFGAPLDLAIEAFQWIGTVDLWPVVFGKAHEGKHIGFGLVH